MRLANVAITGAALLTLCGSAHAQEKVAPLKFPFSDPSRPGVLHVGLVRGSIIVRGGNTKEVIVVARGRAEERNPESRAGGLRQLAQQPALDVTEENNRMEIGSPNWGGGRAADLEIEVPAHTDLKLSTVNEGDVEVDGVEGELEIGNVNGSITLTRVKGSVVAHTVNGAVHATILQVTAQQPMAFTSLNGTVEVSLPSTIKTNLKLRSDNGNVYTDFDLQMLPETSAPVVEESRRPGGRYQVKVNKVIHGAVNGGGPEIEVRTFNGDVYVRNLK